jgi:Ca-activated chloride channel family protein
VPHLQDPAWLLLLALVPLLAWRHHRRPALGALAYSRLPAAVGGAWRLHLPFYSRLLAFACLVVALARPQLGYSWEESLTEGIDIQIALDVSGSMGAEDFQPRDRLTVAKQVVRQFIAGRTGDRVGLTVFSGAALTRAPLTTDRRMLDALVESLELFELPDGTAIGVALASAAARLNPKPQQAGGAAESRIIVLVTDGVNNAGEIDPISAAAVCQGLGIRVYTIGVGTEGRVQVPVPVADPATGERRLQRVAMDVAVDEALLKQVAARTGGRFFRATDPEALAKVFAIIDELEKTPLQVKRYVRYREAFQPLGWGALALLLLPLLGAAARFTAEP